MWLLVALLAAGSPERALAALGLLAAGEEESADSARDPTREQRELAAAANEVATELAPLGGQEAALAQELAARPVDAAKARELRRALVQRFRLAIAPAERPDLRRGGRIWAQACAACHGADGRENPALELSPPAPRFGEAVGRGVLRAVAWPPARPRPRGFRAGLPGPGARQRPAFAAAARSRRPGPVLRQDACHFGAATEQRADPVMLNRFTRLIAGQLFRLQGVPPPELEVTILFADVEVARCSLVTTDHYDCGVAPSDILEAKR